MKKNINFTVKTIKGKRHLNQDALGCAFNKAQNFIAVVCDGVGSVQYSEYASKIAAETFLNEFKKTEKIETPTLWFKQTLKLALDNMSAFAKAHNYPGISTTIAVLIVIGKQFFTYNIGDTRIYAIRKFATSNEIKKYTYDHNYKNFLISRDASQEAILAAKEKWHALTNLLDEANHNLAKFDSNSGRIEQQTYFLIATDGLYAYIHDNDKYNIITSAMLIHPLKLSALIRKAYRNGSDDNISGILVSVK